MSLWAWLAHNERKNPAPVFDTVELDPVIVLEGEAAEEEILRHYTNSVSPFSVHTPCGVAESYPQSLRGERPYTQSEHAR